MSSNAIKKLAVLFADVAESTRLYEILGDVEAQRQIAQCLVTMSHIVTHNNGQIVKTIGDELMCYFADADAAVKAACEIQQSLNAGSDTDDPNRLQVRIGLQYGSTIIAEHDLFGDTINVAARMAGIATAEQIITTEQTINQLSPENRLLCRAIDRAPVKGKQDEITIYKIRWEADLQTVTDTFPLSAYNTVQADLYISHGTTEKILRISTKHIIKLGRSSNCEIVVTASMTSRLHGRFECRRGKVILIDSSANGTYLRNEKGEDYYIHREEILLPEEGIISLGVPIPDADPENLIYFKHRFSRGSDSRPQAGSWKKPSSGSSPAR